MNDAQKALARFEKGKKGEPWISSIDEIFDDEGSVLIYADDSVLYVPVEGEAMVVVP